jgi:hypothetical protein
VLIDACLLENVLLRDDEESWPSKRGGRPSIRGTSGDEPKITGAADDPVRGEATDTAFIADRGEALRSLQVNHNQTQKGVARMQ